MVLDVHRVEQRLFCFLTFLTKTNCARPQKQPKPKYGEEYAKGSLSCRFAHQRDIGRRKIPNRRLTTNITRKTKKMILAIPAALAAIPPNPKTAAMIAMIKKVKAQDNMI